MAATQLTRRDFTGLAGAGLFVFFRGEFVRAQEPARLPTRQSGPTDFNAYLKIGEDGRVTCLVGKVELGQGAMTSLAQSLAEELDVALDRVDVIMGDTDLCPYDMGTFGSMCTPILVPAVRRAGAEARAVLLQMAGERLNAPVERLRVKDGVVSDSANAGRQRLLRPPRGRQTHRAAPGQRPGQAGHRISGDRTVSAAQGRHG